MFERVDNTYHEIRERSLEQWLCEMEKHEDVAVRAGIPLVRDYLEHLKTENQRLQSQNQMKATYLKKIVNEKRGS